MLFYSKHHKNRYFTHKVITLFPNLFLLYAMVFMKAFFCWWRYVWEFLLQSKNKVGESAWMKNNHNQNINKPNNKAEKAYKWNMFSKIDLVMITWFEGCKMQNILDSNPLLHILSLVCSNIHQCNVNDFYTSFLLEKD